MRRLARTTAKTAAFAAERAGGAMGACALPILVLLLALFESALVTVLERLVEVPGVLP